MTNPNARIGRVHQSWRVRVFGHPPKYFADSHYGGTYEALHAAKNWRDARWNGLDRGVKLTAEQRREIAASTEHYKAVAAKYGIVPNYVYQLRQRLHD